VIGRGSERQAEGRDDFLARVYAARPADPDPAASEGACVRTLARFVVLEAGAVAATEAAATEAAATEAAATEAGATEAGATEAGRTEVRHGNPARRIRVARRVAAALLLAALLPLVAASSSTQPPAVSSSSPREIARRARHGALPLRAGGRLRSDEEIRRIARLALVPALRPLALPLLARDPGPAGPVSLGRLLVDVPSAEADVVAALERVAARGRREAALRGLLAGAATGRIHAAAAAVRLGGADHLSRVLAVVPAAALAGPEVVSAVRAGRRTLRARLVRLAAHGDGRALRLAARAGARGIVPLLARETQREEPGRARRAVTLLAGLSDVHAHVALARALEGPAAEHARELLCALPPAVDVRLAARARKDARDAPAALRALTVRGAVGTLVDLAAVPRLGSAAVRALADVAGAGASQALVVLAARPALRQGAVEALGVRLRRGDGEAARGLQRLGRSAQGRAARRELLHSDPAGAAGSPPVLARTRRPSSASRSI